MHSREISKMLRIFFFILERFTRMLCTRHLPRLKKLTCYMNLQVSNMKYSRDTNMHKVWNLHIILKVRLCYIFVCSILSTYFYIAFESDLSRYLVKTTIMSNFSRYIYFLCLHMGYYFLIFFCEYSFINLQWH